MQLVVLNTRQYSVISSEAEEPIRTTSEITDNDVNSQAELLRSRATFLTRDWISWVPPTRQRWFEIRH